MKNMTNTSPSSETLSASILSTSTQGNDYLAEQSPRKRALDIFGAIVGMILAAPLIAAFGFLIYRESPGNIIYKQTRVGRDGKLFTIFKLRSMKLDSETTGVGWTVENDPRCLKVGKLIRAWNIDEVPQFWNVLKGDMSLVGPRPEHPERIERLSDKIPGREKRLTVKPGLTGWAQVNRWRGDTSLQ
ncbi:MAG: lipopolysaccharide/colanic/teichoic acid biosynthesis glycosyltransferase [Verrucomicrobiales bacterium]|jgi:lipopolysaccharide/colanic/teichoic acid biosynthesis glycosyltransferase